MAQKRKARALTVSRTQALTPNMSRITLQGEDLVDFPDDAEGAYFKLVFPGEDPERPTLRTYTVAKYRPECHEIDVDFMMHTGPDGKPDGVAARWAATAQPGDAISIFGPGPATFINTDADWFLLAADMTALPALAANLKDLPTNARGYVVVEILDESDQQSLAVPVGMELIWVVNPQPGSQAAPLHDAIRSLEWRDGRAAVWTACEFTTMKKNRHYLRQERGVEKSHLYISSYWKKGLREEAHKVAKREDASAAA